MRAGVRVRIVTADAALAALPWRLTRWHERTLAVAPGWTFVTSSAVEPARNVTTTAPANVLLLNPQASPPRGAPRDAVHVKALREVLTRVWQDYKAPFLREVRTRKELSNALKGQRPHLLYVHAHAAPGGDAPALLLDGENDTALRLDALVELFAETGHMPAAVYLDVAGATSPSALPLALRDAVPLVVWRRLAEPTAGSGRVALEWLQRWLGDGEDPVTALHALHARNGHANAELATLGVHATYAQWRTERATGFVARPKVHERLDRDAPKALVRKHVADLARSDSQRVMAVIAYGAPGNSVGAFCGQALSYLELEAADVAVIEPRKLHFPTHRADLAAGLSHHLRLLLEADEREPDRHLLRRHGPHVVPGRRRPILWLDWGTFGKALGCQPEIKTTQLNEWVAFCAGWLSANCPDDLRIVSFLAIECEAARHRKLESTLLKLEQTYSREPRFSLSPIDPLDDVKETHLLKFLQGNPNCPATLHVELAQRIHAETGGAFDATVRLLQSGEDGAWYDLADTLRRKQGAAEMPDDDESW